MISDGIENCVQYMSNFNLKNQRIHWDILQIIYYGLVRRIQKKKKNRDTSNIKLWTVNLHLMIILILQLMTKNRTMFLKLD